MKILRRLAVCIPFCLLLAGVGSLSAQTTITATGVVKSSDGIPLSGASVAQKDGKVATITNQEGLFSLKIKSGDALIISYSGYESKEIGANENMEILLTPKPGLLEEVQVVVDKGYGKSKRIAVSSSI